MVVSPKRCLMVTGKALLAGWVASAVVQLDGPVEQAVRVSATAARRAAGILRFASMGSPGNRNRRIVENC
jgi:hypothetical protein